MRWFCSFDIVLLKVELAIRWISVWCKKSPEGRLHHRFGPASSKAQQHLDNAHWLVGFGDGSFNQNQSVARKNSKITITFSITQNQLERPLLLAIKSWFNCGNVYPLKWALRDNTKIYIVSKRSDLTNIIVPFFEKHGLRTVKKQKVIFWTYWILENLCLLLI